ncbi:MAG: hypothetical protein NVSMB13_04650 [Mycobacteriales bacterium]
MRELVKRHQDRSVIFGVMVRGTHQGPFIGVPATGMAVAVAAMIVYEYANGPIVRESAHWDVATRT